MKISHGFRLASAAMTAYRAATYRIKPFPKLWTHQIANVLDAYQLDDYPAAAPPPDSIQYWPEPMDTTRLPARWTGLRPCSRLSPLPAPGGTLDSGRCVRKEAAHLHLRRNIENSGSDRRLACDPLLVLKLTPTIRPLSFV